MPIDRVALEHRPREVEEGVREILRISSKPFQSFSLDEIYSLRHNIIVLVESLASLCINIVIGEGLGRPRSYRESTALASRAVGLDPQCSGELAKLAGLRNTLVPGTGQSMTWLSTNP